VILVPLIEKIGDEYQPEHQETPKSKHEPLRKRIHPGKKRPRR
jgi:hypothetical protein